MKKFSVVEELYINGLRLKNVLFQLTILISNNILIFKLRGENGVGCYAARSLSNDIKDKCEFSWVINTHLKGWIPQKMTDMFMPIGLAEFMESLRSHTRSIKDWRLDRIDEIQVFKCKQVNKSAKLNHTLIRHLNSDVTCIEVM